MKIAVVGSGISGLGSAWLLSRRHDVSLFESRNRLGGHTHTVEVDRPEGRVALDTGFLIYSPDTYPFLTRLFDRLSVETRATDMSFSVQCSGCDLVYAGRGLRGLFAQPPNAIKPSFLGMLNDIRRLAQHTNGESGDSRTLGGFLDQESFGRDFRDHYLIPMASALWSTRPRDVLEFPVGVLMAFFRRHGLLRTRDRLDWRTVSGGSSTYVHRMARDLRGRIHTGTPVTSVRRGQREVEITAGSKTAMFDHVVLATHADQSLAMLEDPTDGERELLGAWQYSKNDTWLHTDEALLPQRPAAWAAWNYLVDDCRDDPPRSMATYGLNRLQGLDGPVEYLVSLNPTETPAAQSVLARMEYRHPMMTPRSTATWSDLPSLNGGDRVWFCGSYFGYGFHEDGLRSAVAVAEALGADGP